MFSVKEEGGSSTERMGQGTSVENRSSGNSLPGDQGREAPCSRGAGVHS